MAILAIVDTVTEPTSAGAVADGVAIARSPVTRDRAPASWPRRTGGHVRRADAGRLTEAPEPWPRRPPTIPRSAGLSIAPVPACDTPARVCRAAGRPEACCPR